MQIEIIALFADRIPPSLPDTEREISLVVEWLFKTITIKFDIYSKITIIYSAPNKC